MIGQFIFAVFLVSSMIGPLGHYLYRGVGGPDLLVIATWGLAWFGGQSNGFRFALIAGILMDLLSFSIFGTWTAGLLAEVVLVDWLRGRFFAASSLVLALLALALGSLPVIVLNALVSNNLVVANSAITILSNVLIGLAIYYIVAVRLRLFQQWTGTRL